MSEFQSVSPVKNKSQLNQATHQKLVTAARFIVVLMSVVVLGLFAAGVPARFSQQLSNVQRLTLLDIGISAGFYSGLVLAVDLLVVFAHIGIAAVILWRRKGDWMALFVAFTLVINGGVLPITTMAAQLDLSPLWVFLERSVVYLSLLSSVILLYIFPDGRFVPDWTRWLAVVWAFIAFTALFLPNSALSLANWPDFLKFFVLLVWSGIGVAVQIYRFLNVSGPVQRQQTKWALLGLTAAVVAPIVLFVQADPAGQTASVTNLFYQRVGSGFFTFTFISELSSSTFFRLGTMIFPVSFAIAILRYRLWDIDLLINRTLVYTTLTGVLIALYFLSVVLFERIFQLLLGQGEISVVVSTLAIAALFNPLRKRIQEIIDRSFYRHKYDALLILARFNDSLREDVDLDQLCENLKSVVNETVQPEAIWLWMKD